MLTAFQQFCASVCSLPSDEQEPSHVSEDEVKYLIREGRKSGVFEPSEEDLIHSVFRFTDTVVKEVMVPRTEIVAVEAGSDIDSILRTMNEKGFSRLPVYSETIDNIIGVVYLKDILPLHLSEQGSSSLTSVLRKPYIVPPNKNVSVLLKEMREKRIHLALVGDEYGGTDGLVTMEDLIEEIVGDIRDEQEKELREIDEIAANRYIVDGRTDIGKLNENWASSCRKTNSRPSAVLCSGSSADCLQKATRSQHQNLLFTVLRLRKNRISASGCSNIRRKTRREGNDEDATGTRD